MTLSKGFLEKQKNALLEEKSKAEANIKKFKEFPEYGWDEEDNIRELTDYENNQPFEVKFEEILKKINKALKAIETGTYGQCSKCQNAIEEGRLDIVPYADICVSCAPKKK